MSLVQGSLGGRGTKTVGCEGLPSGWRRPRAFRNRFAKTACRVQGRSVGFRRFWREAGSPASGHDGRTGLRLKGMLTTEGFRPRVQSAPTGVLSACGRFHGNRLDPRWRDGTRRPLVDFRTPATSPGRRTGGLAHIVGRLWTAQHGGNEATKTSWARRRMLDRRSWSKRWARAVAAGMRRGIGTIPCGAEHRRLTDDGGFARNLSSLGSGRV